MNGKHITKETRDKVFTVSEVYVFLPYYVIIIELNEVYKNSQNNDIML